MSSSFGQAFCVTTFGESHGAGVGAIVDGCPAGVPLQCVHVQRELDRRRPGQSAYTTPRQEADQVEILSGVQDGHTLGVPIAMLIRNQDARPGDYEGTASLYRPSHADYTTHKKYGVRPRSGGGRASARETAARVAAGAVARQYLAAHTAIDVAACVVQVGGVSYELDAAQWDLQGAEASPVRCPDAAAAQHMQQCIAAARDVGDSVGGVIIAVARGVPPGLGEPVFDKLEADLAKAMLSIPATKAFEIGSGFAAAAQRGSQHNDAFYSKDGRVRTRTNNSGGVQGGISNGEDIVIRIAFKPPATFGQVQQTVDEQGHAAILQAKGRHDPCVVPRAVPIVEAMFALTLADHHLRQQRFKEAAQS